MNWVDLESKDSVRKGRYYGFDLPRIVCLLCIIYILPGNHYSSFILKHLDLTSCILISFKYILTITLLQIFIIYIYIYIYPTPLHEQLLHKVNFSRGV